jgi:hypothetical protein
MVGDIVSHEGAGVSVVRFGDIGDISRGKFIWLGVMTFRHGSGHLSQHQIHKQTRDQQPHQQHQSPTLATQANHTITLLLL